MIWLPWLFRPGQSSAKRPVGATIPEDVAVAVPVPVDVGLQLPATVAVKVTADAAPAPETGVVTAHVAELPRTGERVSKATSTSLSTSSACLLPRIADRNRAAYSSAHGCCNHHDP